MMFSALGDLATEEGYELGKTFHIMSDGQKLSL